MKQVLLTGFEPFGGDTLNPSREVALRLHGEVIAGAQVQALELPCVFGAAAERLREALSALQPALVLCLGLATQRSEVSVERVALNLDDARIADNAGAQPVDTPVVAGAPAAYFARLPVKAMVAAVQAQGLPAGLSFSAGSFVCNHVFFALMHELASQPVLSGTRGGFVHLPPLPEQPVQPGSGTPLALDEQVRALRLAVAVALTQGDDLHLPAGNIA